MALIWLADGSAQGLQILQLLWEADGGCDGGGSDDSSTDAEASRRFSLNSVGLSVEFRREHWHALCVK